MTDEPRWRRVEDALQTEAAARRDSDDLILVIGRPSFGERTQHRPLQFDALAIVRVATANDLVDKTAVATKVVEVTAATQEQRVLKPLLKMAVRVLLAEDHLPLGPRKCSPCAHTSLQRASNVGRYLGMATADFFQHRNGSDAGCRLQDRHNLLVPKCRQWVRPPTATRNIFLRG